MLYSVLLKKSDTFWWDEDSYGSMLFFAGDDVAARRFAETVLQIMNRSYEKIKQPQKVLISRLSRVHIHGQFGAKKNVVTPTIFIESVRFKRLCDLRDVYRTLFPSVVTAGAWYRDCALSSFYEYKPQRILSLAR